MQSETYVPVVFSWVGSGGGGFAAEARIQNLVGNDKFARFILVTHKLPGHDFGCTRQRWRITTQVRYIDTNMRICHDLSCSCLCGVCANSPNQLFRLTTKMLMAPEP